MAKKTISRKAIKVIKKKAVKAPSKKKAEAKNVEPVVTIDISKHVLVPKHEILTPEEVETVFSQFHVQPQHLPVIFINDPALQTLGPKMGDIVRVTRASPTAGTAIFYRRVAYE